MANATLPLAEEDKVTSEQPGNLLAGEAMPEPLGKACEENPHLLEYVRRLPIRDTGMPQYVPELSRKMGDNKQPNIIYPVHQDNVFIHILYDPNDVRSSYIPIEPTLAARPDSLMLDVETGLLNLGRKLPRLNPDEDRPKQLLAYLTMVTSADGQPKPSLLDRGIGFLRKDGASVPKVKVTPREFDAIKYLFIRDKIGMGILEPSDSRPLHRRYKLLRDGEYLR